MPRGARSDSRTDLLLAAACSLVSLTLLVLPDGPRQSTAAAIRGTVVAPLAAMQQRAALARQAFTSHDSLVAIADSVVRRSQRLDEVEAENERLRGILGLGRALRWGFIPAEALVGRGMGDDHTLVLSAGSRAGVERLSAVVSSEGLVGMVQQVDAGTSIAITWPHPDFRVSATSVDGTAFGIVSAHQAQGAEGYLLELRGVNFRQKLNEGTLVMSSGLGGVFPRGIPIGTVLSELRTVAGWERTYLLRPAVRPANVTSVLVLRPEKNAQGVESTWSVVREAELVRRAVADSIAAAQAAARRAAADSARRRTPADSAARDPVARDTTGPRAP